MGDSFDDDFGPDDGFAEATTYRASAFVQLVRALALAVGGIFALSAIPLLVWIAIALLMAYAAFSLLVGLPAENVWPAPMIAILIAIELAISAIAGLVAWIMLRFAFTTPTGIIIDGDGRIGFRSWWRTIWLRPDDVHSVETGAWFGPSRFLVVVRHKSGEIAFFNQFRDFHGFLARLKALNPAVEVRGF